MISSLPLMCVTFQRSGYAIWMKIREDLSIFNIYHIYGTLFAAITQQGLHMHKLFPAKWLSACCDDNKKLCILEGERLLYLAGDVDH